MAEAAANERQNQQDDENSEHAGCSCKSVATPTSERQPVPWTPTPATDCDKRGVFGVSAALREIAALLRFLGETRFKVEAYERAADVVEAVGTELAPRVEGDRMRELAGIGPALAQQIAELWGTGTSRLLERLRQQAPPGAAELSGVDGMTPRRIRALSAELGIASVAELRAACLEQRVRHVPGFGARTEAVLLAACSRWQQRLPQVPSPLVIRRAEELLNRLIANLAEGALLACGAGSLRRGAETINELALVIVGPEQLVWERLARLRQVLRIDATHRAAQLSGGVTLSIWLANERNFGSVLVEATGSAAHVSALDQRARSLGVSLADWPTEHALYGALELDYVPPELRTGANELELAARHELPRLLEVEDIRGFIHCHTTYSDGRSSVLEMARAAHALGKQYITITDHSPSAHYASGTSLRDLERQHREIEAAQAEVPIRILRGIEADILADGSLDLPSELLDQLDIVIASIHARHRMSSKEMTERIQRALSLPIFKVWGHALGRILNHRDPIDCDVLALLDTLSRSPGAIELNADPHRLDLPPDWIPAARERGIPFVVSVDAHSTQGFDALRHGVTMARRGALTRSQVLNTLPAPEFCARVKPRAPA